MLSVRGAAIVVRGLSHRKSILGDGVTFRDRKDSAGSEHLSANIRRRSDRVTTFIGVRRWWTLRWQGHADGRKRLPDALLAEAPVSTSVRRMLQEQFLEHAESLRGQCVAEIERCRTEVGALMITERDLGAALVAAIAELNAIEAERPDPAVAAVRRPVERHRPEALVQARRTREYERRRRVARAEVTDLQRRLEVVSRRRAEVEQHVVGLERTSVQAAHRLRARYERAEAIYRRALLSRHPQSVLLQTLLDDSPLVMPRWAEPGR